MDNKNDTEMQMHSEEQLMVMEKKELVKMIMEMEKMKSEMMMDHKHDHKI